MGALGQAFTSDRFGRRGSILIWSGIFTIGVVIQTATTFSIVQITIGRFIAGLGVGALSGLYITLELLLGLNLTINLSDCTVVQWRNIPKEATWNVARPIPTPDHHWVSNVLCFIYGAHHHPWQNLFELCD